MSLEVTHSPHSPPYFTDECSGCEGEIGWGPQGLGRAVQQRSETVIRYSDISLAQNCCKIQHSHEFFTSLKLTFLRDKLL